MKRKKQFNNDGFTLVEFIVVIAIMALVAGLSVIGFGMISSSNVNKISKSLSGILTQTKTSALSVEGSWNCEVYYQSGDWYAVTKKTVKKNTAGVVTDEVSVMNKVKLGGNITIKFISDDGTEYELDTTEKLDFAFNKKTGKCTITLPPGKTPAGATGPSSKLEIKICSGKNAASVYAYVSTGKISID